MARLAPGGVGGGGGAQKRDLTSWSIGKGWENCHLGIKRDF